MSGIDFFVVFCVELWFYLLCLLIQDLALPVGMRRRAGSKLFYPNFYKEVPCV